MFTLKRSNSISTVLTTFFFNNGNIEKNVERYSGLKVINRFCNHSEYLHKGARALYTCCYVIVFTHTVYRMRCAPLLTFTRRSCLFDHNTFSRLKISIFPFFKLTTWPINKRLNFILLVRKKFVCLDFKG